MQIVDEGSGAPLVLIPGIQGRWEYLGPAIDALSTSFRVITFPLRGEPRSGGPYDRARGFDNYADQMVDVLDALHIERALVCGVSFGGLVAVHIAACRAARVNGLILVSTPGPGWRPSTRHLFYARMPRLLGPLFLAETPWRLRSEISHGFWKLASFLKAPVSLTRMAERGQAISTADTLADCARITTPTLVVTGERTLDRIVPVDGSLEYLRLIRGATSATIEGTGHLGAITRPERFTEIVRHAA